MSKKMLDIAGSMIGLAMLAIMLPFIAISIKLDSKGDIFFPQKRCGRAGREFYMLKFRTMRNNAEEIKAALKDKNEVNGPMFKLSNDPRITRVGSFLRKTKLDEFPQFLNILAGNMTLVGPRPLEKEEMEGHPEWKALRLTVKPGLTGLWQIQCSNYRDFNEWIIWDRLYIENRSLWLDIKIILRTAKLIITNIFNNIF
ncbi:MAG: sugar transferase [Deltaproteobacteria bacterium]|nr:sugar transferase [Deltaproteobacteria bacterium]